MKNMGFLGSGITAVVLGIIMAIIGFVLGAIVFGLFLAIALHFFVYFAHLLGNSVSWIS